MERFNLEAARNLNTHKYTVAIYAKNSNIIDGMTLTNLVSNGTFTSSAYWQTSGSASFSYANNRSGNYSVYKANKGYIESYLYQDLHFQQNSKYYYSIEHSSASNSSFLTYIGSTSNGSLNTAGSNDAWTKTSGIYETRTSPLDQRLYVGRNSNGGSVFLTHAMVVNLTSSFGRGYEPDKKWMDDNLEYFDGTISYIRHEQIESGESLTVKFNPYAGFKISSRDIKCINPKTGGSITPMPSITPKTEAGRTIQELKISSVSSDIKCKIDWKE